MIALDTNILVRFLTQDDPVQSPLVLARFEAAERDGERFLVSSVVILELIWVLQSAYRVDRADIINAIEQLAQMPIIKLGKPLVITQFVQAARSQQGDLADMLIAQVAFVLGATTVLTFDRKASNLPEFTELSA